MEESTTVTRTEGDGMEAFETITQEPCSHVGMINDLQNLTLSTGKSTERVINIVPKVSPVVPMSKSQPDSEKKAKFVPYEPYKAAVKPIVPIIKKKKKNLNGSSISTTLSPDVSVMSDVSSNDCKWKEESNQDLWKEIEQLKLEKAAMADELKLHAQVNAELKKLLVASVGEDMEARVHFLTEDKAKLGDDIRRYVEKIAVDFEQKEKLAIEADIWRSKFLASSVIIEELAKWKSVLCCRNDELQGCVRDLLDEMNTLHKTLSDTFKQLRTLNTAFDPLGSAGPAAAGDVLNMAGANLNLIHGLSKRLLGAYTKVRGESTADEMTQSERLTSAQTTAHVVLTQKPAATCQLSDLSSQTTTHQVSSMARRSLNKSQFSCCPHCTGQVYTV